MRQVEGNRGTTEDGLDAFERSFEAGAFTVEFIDYDGAGQFEFIGELPNLLGLNLDAGHSIHHHEGGLGSDHGRLGVIYKNVEPRGVQEIDLLLLPFDIGEGGGNRDLPGHFLVVEIGEGVALIDACQAVGRPGTEEHARCERCLSGIAVADQRNVPYVRAFVDLHV